MKMLKKNQVIIYVTALMLVAAGYLNYTSTNNFGSAIQTSSSEEELTQMANMGDAQLVSSNVLVENNEIKNNSISTNNTITENRTESSNIETENESATTNSEVIKNNSSYFSTSKLERDTMYSQMLETYTKVLNSNNSLETQKQSAQQEITKINNIKNSIMVCENLIKIKGFENSVIFVNGDSINIIVEDDELSLEKVAQIQNIISREMNAKIENIHISSK